MPDATSELLPPRGFTHDDEHPQVRIPFTAQVAARQLRGESLSLTKAVVRGLIPPTVEHARQPATLRFDLNGFTVSLFLEVRIDKVGPTEDAEVELHIVDPTGPHLAPLRYLLNSAIAGDVSSIGGVLGYTGPVAIKPKAAAAEPSFGGRMWNWLRRGAVAAATLALLYGAAVMVHDRVIFAYEPRPVTLATEGQVMRATAGGQLSFIDLEAQEGEVVYSILSNAGSLLSIRMPCDCAILAEPDATVGATVLPGTPLMTLTRGAEALEARTEVTPEGAARLLEGDQAELVFPDGRIEPVELTLLPDEAETAALIPAELVLPSDFPGEPGDVARLRFAREIIPGSLFDRLPGLRIEFPAQSADQ